jgi:hypothetical protein
VGEDLPEIGELPGVLANLWGGIPDHFPEVAQFALIVGLTLPQRVDVSS